MRGRSDQGLDPDRWKTDNSGICNRSRMSRLLICSECDLPSYNMKASLKAMGGWEELGSSGDAVFSVKDDTYMLSIPDMHVYHDDLDAEAADFGIDVDEVVVMSKHSAKSGKPALTVHPIGNYKDNEFGGRERTLVKASPALMSDALRLIVRYNDVPDVQTCFEVTHHGPWLDKPTFYIEIGSEETHWGDKHSADILAKVITDMTPNDDYPTVVGIGGGHYAPRFTELVLSSKVNMGHMIPNYQLEGSDDEEIAKMVRDACAASGTDYVYIHRKSMKGSEERRIKEIVQSEGLSVSGSKDFDKI